MRRSLLILACLLVGAPAWATGYRALTLPQLLAAAEIAFVGTVASQRVEAREGEPWTVVEFDVERWLLGGAAQGRRQDLSFLGGELVGEGLRVSLMPRFEVGERVLLLAHQEEYYSPIVGFNQGLWRLEGRGLVDEQGRFLGLDEAGRLAPDAPERGSELVIDSVARELEARR
jgi:hypothetical protein